MSRSIRRTAIVLSMLAPAVAAAQGLKIEHSPARCIVAGRPARLRACFVAAAEIATARVHFRPESRESWSQVAMHADAGCYAGVLPALGRELVGQKILYSIEAVDRASASHRTSEFAPELVARAADCADRGAVAPSSGGGVSKAVVIGGVAAAGVAGAVIAAGGDSASPATTIGAAPTTTAPPATQPPVAPTPPPGAGLALSCQADPRSGPAPLRIEFTAFPTGATGSYAFEWSFGDGGTSNNPNPSHTYVVAGRFDAVVRVTSGSETATCTRDITVTAPSGPGPTPTPAPTPTPTAPPPPARTLTVSTSGNFPGTATSNPPGISCSFPPQSVCTATFSHGTSVTLSAPPIPAGSTTFSGDCMGVNSCTVVMNADKQVAVFFFRSSAQLGTRDTRPLAGSSHLDVPGAEGQLVANDGAAVAMRAGLVPMTVPTRSGANRVEGVLVRAGQPGTWRFDLGGVHGIKPGSLRAIVGTVALITTDTVVFRLEGKPGERVVFTFEIDGP